MARLPNGMIVFILDRLPDGPKLLDIEVTNTFPLFSLFPRAILINKDGSKEALDGYNHISIPPDLRLHLSHRDHHIFFDISAIYESLDKHVPLPLIHLFTYIGLPYKMVPPLVKPGETKTWHQAEIISPFRDALFNSETRLFVDFFVHSFTDDINLIANYPYFTSGMRPASDRHGSILGPYDFSSIQRKNLPPRSDIAFTIRFGYVDYPGEDVPHVYSPLDIYSRRPRQKDSQK